MLTQTGTTTVNAAFLKDLKADNLHLRELLLALNQIFSRPIRRSIRPVRLAELLGRLRDQLATHFALAEFFGYFDDAVNVAPRLSIQADILRSQHEALFSEICDLVNDAESLLYHESQTINVDDVAQRYRSFNEHLRSHETCENALILNALHEDIGVAD